MTGYTVTTAVRPPGRTAYQLTTPLRDPRRPTLDEIAVHPHAGRLYRCRRCGRTAWSAFGHARRHRRYCRAQVWPWGRP